MSVNKRRWVDPKTGQAKEAWFVDIVYNDGGRQKRIRRVAFLNTRRGAEQEERKLREEIAAGTHGKPPAPLFRDFAKDFLKDYVAVHNKPSEVDGKRWILDAHLSPFFEKYRLDEIGSKEIDAYVSALLASGRKPKTVKNHQGVLSKLLHVAVDWGVLEAVPRIRSVKAPRPKFDFLSFEEADRLVAVCNNESYPFVVLALRTGMRLGELRALRWEDLDLVAGKVLVRRSLYRGHFGSTKSGKEREIPLSDLAVATLKQARHLRELVFSFPGGKPWGTKYARKLVAYACKRAGLRIVGCHVLRHTFASHLVMRNVPLKTVQEFMGHATMEMTNRYAHLSPEVKTEAVARLDSKAPVGHNGGQIREQFLQVSKNKEES